MKHVGVGCALLALWLVGCDGAAGEGTATNPSLPAAGSGGLGGSASPAESGSLAPPVQAAGGAPGLPSAGSSASAGQGGSAGATDPVMQPDAAVPSPDAATGNDDGWETLISAQWELQPNQERYFCQRVTLTEDVYVSAIKAINPPGTHHTALTAAASAGDPDGLTECNSNLEPQGIFGSGVGTEPVVYPEGVGLRLRAGQQLLLNLHVFNVTQQPLTGMSGTAIKRADPAAVQHVAESLLAGPTRFSVPAGETTTVRGQCTMTHDVTLFAVQPHMHQIGVHMKGVAMSSTRGEVVLHDGDFDFENQIVYPIEPLEMKQGDVVQVECTFDNQSDAPVRFGESSNQEMCFMVLHRYPAADRPAVTCFM